MLRCAPQAPLHTTHTHTRHTTTQHNHHTALELFPLIGVFSARNNQLSGPLPKWLLAMPILELDLGRNKLDGPLPSTVGKNPFTRDLLLDGNHIEGHLLDVWHRLVEGGQGADAVC